MSTKCDDDGFILEGQGFRLRVFGAGRQIHRRAALLPLGDGLLIDAVAPGQRSQALLTMLYRSTDRLWENLAHSASFHSLENNAPSNPGIKHLVDTV